MTKILLVEDDMMNEKLFLFLLEKEGWTVVHKNDGSGIIDEIKNFRPDAILMDINLPGANGEELCTMIRKDPEIGDSVILALTAYAMKGDHERFIRSGFDGYFSKPINAMAFISEIKSYL